MVDVKIVGLGSGPQDLGQYILINMTQSIANRVNAISCRHITKNWCIAVSLKVLICWNLWEELQSCRGQAWLWFLKWLLKRHGLAERAAVWVEVASTSATFGSIILSFLMILSLKRQRMLAV